MERIPSTGCRILKTLCLHCMKGTYRNGPMMSYSIGVNGPNWTDPFVWSSVVKCDAFLSKPIPSDANLITLFLKIRVGEWHMEGLRIGYQLYGTVFGFFDSVNRRNNGKCLLI